MSFLDRRVGGLFAGFFLLSVGGPARAECVDSSPGVLADPETIQCSGVFLANPNNAFWLASSPSPARYYLVLGGLTQHLLPDAFNPGIFLNGIQSAGRTGDDGIFADGGAGGSGAHAAPLEIGADTGSWGVYTVGDTTSYTAMSHGVAAISRGGDGGNGGDSSADIIANGGRGGNAGAAGYVLLNVSGFINTTGDGSHGILGQSLGGNGGNGGSGWGVTASGGNGGNASGGSLVNARSWATIFTHGDRAHGIMAQSAGGRGGAGGTGFAFASDGGRGGITADAFNAIVTNYGNITVEGAQSYGILAQSIGGFGGKGGLGGGLVGFGGDPASAGNGAQAAVDNYGNISTGRNDSHGIVAQSIGGGGGVGGAGVGIAGLGASGAIGGTGGDVLLRNLSSFGAATIRTTGDRSTGLFAQSIGGGGGDGGASAGILSLGGTGSGTSNAGAVLVTNEQAISTIGRGSHAIFAQSIGGGGGNGGASLGLFTVGGDGGGGGDGSLVRVTNLVGRLSGDPVRLTTEGDDAVGIFAQSVGGGGGNGGAALAGGPGFAMSIGGQGGSGGNGGNVQVNPFVSDIGSSPTGSIRTGGPLDGGDNAHGILAQSIGGGGGNGGFAFAGSVGEGASAAVALGGNGGAGGNAGTVLVNQNGSIQTIRASANGIFAQSVGGGGGNGGGSLAASISGGKSVSFALGGRGGTGGKGNTVNVNYVGRVTTGGEHSNGIFAQSVGGGGGNGGFSAAASLGQVAASFALGGDGGAGSEGSTVTVNVPYAREGITNVAGFIGTVGDFSNGIFAQSVGGGGGNGGFAGAGSLAASSAGSAIGLSMGGAGGSGGFAGNVNVSNVSQITTLGTKSAGILAQSVGGGGGNGGFSLTAGGGGGKGLSAAIGGGGGGGKVAGIVNVTNSGLITTSKQQSYGILAQSVGGGGGNGGFAFSGSAGMQLASDKGLSAAVTIGGGGGEGSDGGAVTVNNTGSVTTRGQTTHAIVAQSIGGGGGNGGWAGSVAINAGSGASLGLAIGGTGGSGGDGGTVLLNSGVGASGDVIDTTGDGASGLFAQSVGGGGGNGGHGFAGAFGYGAGEKTINASVAIGGGGGDGGLGSSVDVDNQSGIITRGANASGIFAQSIGGGGGNGGFAVTGTLSLPSPAPGSRTLPVGVSVGGGGGSGGIAGNVSVRNNDTITTLNDESRGIQAQSIGGGGGNGGLAVTAQLSGAATRTAVTGAAVGGAGGIGNTAGTVTVINDAGGALNTTGFAAHGVQAQSIGGGGGNGGMSVLAQLGMQGGTPDAAGKALNVGISVGGEGGSGGTGNTVTVTNNGAINVAGRTAMGIYAQSVGGGGGDGGGAVMAVGLQAGTAEDTSKELNIRATLGGNGGSSNTGGAVTVTNTGGITTQSGTGHGIFAQSIGGGGGIGGRTNTFDFVGGKNEATSFTLGAKVGGDGGTASNGNTVIVDNSGAIETFGMVADGIHAQSIGGGGGDGANGGNGFDELVPEDFQPPGFALLTEFEKVDLDQVDIAVGGSGGSSGDGALVYVINNNDVTTRGSNSAGIFAQSIGGGGGAGGRGVSGLSGLVGVGGTGNAGGNSGNVGVIQTGRIETFGAAASGIFAQAVGGGGGSSGNVDRMFAEKKDTGLGFDTPDWNIGVGIALGGGAGAGGSGGITQVVVDGAIVTRGDAAAGIFAQSVGGGGGMLGDLGTGLLGSWALGSNGDAGNGGPVLVQVTGSVTTAGNSATGIFAQSAGGAGTGGVVQIALSDATIETGAVLDPTLGGTDLDGAGNRVRGQGAVGILAQSIGNAANNANNGDITIDIQGTGSIVRGGRRGSGAAGVGIAVVDGNHNTLNNHGLVTTLDGVDDGFAILAKGSNETADADFNPVVAAQQGGHETVHNFGTITGSVGLGGGIDLFFNESTGTINAGAVIDLGAGELFTNSGWLAPGGDGRAFSTVLNGDLLQADTGFISLDVLGVGEGEFDRLFVTGALSLTGGTAVFDLGSGVTFDLFTESFRIFDFILAGSPFNTQSLFGDITLFQNLNYVVRNSAGSVDLLLTSNGSFSAVPLPGSLSLLLTGLAGLGGRRWLQRSAAR